MAKVFFSSWNGNIVDERKKSIEDRLALESLKLPGEVAGRELKAYIGWAGLVIVDPGVNVVEALAAYFKSVQQESCGRCIPCRAGSKVLADRLDKLIEGRGTEEDLLLLKEIADLVREGSLCELGITAPAPLLHALEYFKEDFIAYLGEKAPSNGIETEYKAILTAPCRNGCPAHINIPGYIEAIKEGNYDLALAINREKTPFVGTLGRVCVHPCEENCNRLPCDSALSIRLLKRFAADYGAKNSFDHQGQDRHNSSLPAEDADRIAVVGAGPAGLNAAYQLAQKGYRVTVYEALPIAGGMLAVGIPSYRLPRHILNAEIELVTALGVEIIYNTKVGVDITIAQLREEGFKAIFIAGGLHESSTMGCEGEDQCYYGYMPGVEFLRRINLGEKVDLGDRVAVIGGGNVAMDCARSAVRLGAKEVHLVYRRSRLEMPANRAEIDAAEEEGIIFHLLANPTCILDEKGAVSGMECIRMELGEPDASGRRRPVPMDGSEFILGADTVIPAIGQVADLCYLEESCAMEVTGWNTLVVDEETMETADPGIFAGGDVVLGARTVIEAIASANRAAEAIDNYLRQGKSAVGDQKKLERHLEKTGVYNEDSVPEMVCGRLRLEEEVLPVEERAQGFAEADLGFKYTLEAVGEAQRCVKCLRLGLAVLSPGRDRL